MSRQRWIVAAVVAVVLVCLVAPAVGCGPRAPQGKLLSAKMQLRESIFTITNQGSVPWTAVIISLNVGGRYAAAISEIGAGESVSLERKDFKNKAGQPLAPPGYKAYGDPIREATFHIEATTGGEKGVWSGKLELTAE